MCRSSSLYIFSKVGALIFTQWYTNIKMVDGDFKNLNNNKGDSNYHKTDEKLPIWRCTFLHQLFWIKKKIIPLHPELLQKFIGLLLLLLLPILTEKCAPPFCQLFYLVLTQNNHLPLGTALIFCFILVRTLGRWVRN